MHLVKRISTLAVLLFLLTGVAFAVTFTPVIQWNGTHYRVMNSEGGEYEHELVSSPLVDIPFDNASGVAAYLGNGGEIISLVGDSFWDRVQQFEVGATYLKTTNLAANYIGGGVAAATVGQWSTDGIRVNATGDILEGSEKVVVDGETWTRVSDLTGYVAADKVYTIQYYGLAGPAATAFGVITMPAASLAQNTSTVTVWCVETGAVSAGAVTKHWNDDVDYLDELTEVLPTGLTQNFENITGITFNQNEATATTQDVYVLDAGIVGSVEAKLHSFEMEDDGSARTYQDTYDGPMRNPMDVAIAESGANTTITIVDDGAWVNLTAVAGTLAGTVLNPALAVNHDYDFVLATPAVAGGLSADFDGFSFEVVDVTLGQTIGFYHINYTTSAQAYIIDNLIPGVRLTHTPAAGDNSFGVAAGTVVFNITLSATVINEHMFIADTGNDRISVLKGASNGEDAAAVAAGQVFMDDVFMGADDSTDVAGTMTTTPWAHRGMLGVTSATSEPHQTFYMGTPITRDGSLVMWTKSTAGDSTTWTEVDNLAGSTSSDNHFEYDEDGHIVTFGDGNFGAIPGASDSLFCTYKLTPLIGHFGTTGSVEERFNQPRGISSRWNASQGWYDVYVADTGNNRIVKMYFDPTADGMDGDFVWVTEWTYASGTTDLLDAPEDVYVLESANNQVYVFIADTGNNRVVVFRDTVSEQGVTFSTTLPTHIQNLGSEGTGFGQYTHPVSVSAVQNGNTFDIFVTDDETNYVTKYELGDDAVIDCDYSNISTNGYLPTGSYTFVKQSANSLMSYDYPDNAYIQFFYSDTTTAGQASPTMLHASSVQQPADTTTMWTWDIATTPGGAPADGVYYLYARLYDENGVFLAEDKSPASSLFTIDSSILQGTALLDAKDDDLYLYLQNSSIAQINVAIPFPDSVATVNIAGTFPDSLMQITDIVVGPAWESVQHESQVFQPDWDNTAGTWEINTGVIGSNTGLVEGATSYVVAVITVTVNEDAVSPDSRYYLGTMDITSASLADWKGETLAQPDMNDGKIYIGYLGDIATPNVSTGSLPNMYPTPDGVFGYDDVVAFTMGWNGQGGTQDPIADLGPTQGTAVPALWSTPDGLFDVEDLFAFTRMFTWYTSNFAPNTKSGAEIAELDESVYLTTEVVESGDERVVRIYANEVNNLMAASFKLFYDGSVFSYDSELDGQFLTGGETGIFQSQNYEGMNRYDLFVSRLNSENPGVSGSGLIAEIAFDKLTEGSDEFAIEFDLRDSRGRVVEEGTFAFNDVDGDGTELPTEFSVGKAYPNPFNPTAMVNFAIPSAGDVEIAAYNIMGQRVFHQVQHHEVGNHSFVFDANANGSMLAGGVYFLQVRHGKNVNVQKVVLLK